MNRYFPAHKSMQVRLLTIFLQAFYISLYINFEEWHLREKAFTRFIFGIFVHLIKIIGIFVVYSFKIRVFPLMTIICNYVYVSFRICWILISRKYSDPENTCLLFRNNILIAMWIFKKILNYSVSVQFLRKAKINVTKGLKMI